MSIRPAANAPKPVSQKCFPFVAVRVFDQALSMILKGIPSHRLTTCRNRLPQVKADQLKVMNGPIESSVIAGAGSFRPINHEIIFILVSTDHGSGNKSSKWSSHGEFIKGSSQTWLAVIGQLIQNQEYFWVKGPVKFRRPAITKRDVANTAIKVDRSRKSAYFGLSNATIAKKLNCSLSQACKRKHKAEQAGLLETKEHFFPIYKFDKADRNIHSRIYASFPQLINRLRFRTTVKDPLTEKKKIELAGLQISLSGIFPSGKDKP